MEQAALAGQHDASEAAHAPLAFPTADQKVVLKSSFTVIEPALGLVATLFFRRLDDIAPEVRALLPDDEAEQHRQLVSSLALAIAALDRFPDIHPALKLLGTRFRALGVTEFHYGAVGEALLWTLKQSMGDRWTPEVADAWTAFCTDTAEIMTGNSGHPV